MLAALFRPTRLLPALLAFALPVIATALRRERSGVVYELMRERNIPIYEVPEEAARAVYGLYTYSRVLKRAS